MKPAPFELHVPTSVEQAVALLATYAAGGGRVLAGGQSLVPAMALRLARPAHLIDINRVAGLDSVHVQGDELVIGARVCHAALQRPAVQGPLGELLAAVVLHIGHTPIRVRGTFCGSLANADPASEWCLVTVTWDTKVVLRSARATRTVPMTEFIEGALTTARADDELLVEARLALPAADLRWGFAEFSRRSADFALGMALVTYRIVGGVIVEPRVGVGAIEAVPRRVPQAEAALLGRPPSSATIALASEAAASALDPVADPRCGAQYRRDLARTLVARAAARAGGVEPR